MSAHCYSPPYDPLGAPGAANLPALTLDDPVGGGADGRRTPFVIGVSGGSASGKGVVCDELQEKLQGKNVVFIPSDCFYRELSQEDKDRAHRSEFDFDEPAAYEWGLLESVLEDLLNRVPTTLPHYCFNAHSRVPDKARKIAPGDVIVVEGILIFAGTQKLNDMMDLKVFVDCDADVRLARRVLRDISERGRDLCGVLDQYARFVKPSFERYVEPAKKVSDVVIPNVGADGINMRAVDLLLKQIAMELQVRAVVGDDRKRGRSSADLVMT